MITIVYITIHLLLTEFYLLAVKKDKEFHLNVTKKDRLILLCFEIINAVILYLHHTHTVMILFLIPTLAYLTIAAYTDKKTMLVHFSPLFLFLAYGVLLESLSLKSFSFFVIAVFAFPILLGIVGAYGLGDIPMCIVLGGAVFFMTYDVFYSLLMECFMITIAEVIFVVKAFFEKNLKNPFQLKESSPLGPSILLATYITLFYTV